jgi:hypothetical protein
VSRFLKEMLLMNQPLYPVSPAPTRSLQLLSVIKGIQKTGFELRMGVRGPSTVRLTRHSLEDLRGKYWTKQNETTNSCGIIMHAIVSIPIRSCIPFQV